MTFQVFFDVHSSKAGQKTINEHETSDTMIVDLQKPVQTDQPESMIFPSPWQTKAKDRLWKSHVRAHSRPERWVGTRLRGCARSMISHLVALTLPEEAYYNARKDISSQITPNNQWNVNDQGVSSGLWRSLTEGQNSLNSHVAIHHGSSVPRIRHSTHQDS